MWKQNIIGQKKPETWNVIILGVRTRIELYLIIKENCQKTFKEKKITSEKKISFYSFDRTSGQRDRVEHSLIEMAPRWEIN